MIDEKKELFYWREDGQPVLSYAKPDNPQSLASYRQIKSALPRSTPLLDTPTAIEIGLAKSIEDFGGFIVGEYLGKDNWQHANQYGRVCNEIGSVIAELKPLREWISESDKHSGERSGSKGYHQYKKSLDKAIDQLDIINKALEQLYQVHPERYAYFKGSDGRTVLADPEAWGQDVTLAKREYGRAANQLPPA